MFSKTKKIHAFFLVFFLCNFLFFYWAIFSHFFPYFFRQFSLNFLTFLGTKIPHFLFSILLRTATAKSEGKSTKKTEEKCRRISLINRENTISRNRRNFSIQTFFKGLNNTKRENKGDLENRILRSVKKRKNLVFIFLPFFNILYFKIKKYNNKNNSKNK